jgi:putative hydrolase of HD superfamily
MEGADPSRTATLCVIHDLHETRLGDLTPLTRRYLSATADPRTITADQTAHAHPAIRDALAAAVDEFETNTTPEARCAHDADKLDCIMRAIEYRSQGYGTVREKIERCYQSLSTPSARILADAALAMDPTDWQQRFTAEPAVAVK